MGVRPASAPAGAAAAVSRANMVLGLTIHLPPAATAQEFKALPRGDARVVAGALALCRELGLGDAKLFETGSLPVFAAGDAHVVQRRHSLAHRWVEQIPSFLARTALAPVERPVLLQTEIMRAHVLAVHGAAGWSLSGVVDFEPAMVGAAEYEFASAGVFFTCGSGPALRALLLAYGYDERELGLPLQRRLLAHTLLHRYSNLRWYLELLPTGDEISTLDALAARWWALGDEPDLSLRGSP